DGGGLGDMGQHYIDTVQYILGKDNENTVSIDVDSPQQHSDAVGTWRRKTYTFADGCQIILDGEGKDVGKGFIEGPNGKLYKGFVCDIPNIEQKLAQFPDPEMQVTDFLRSVRTREKFALNEINGHRSSTLVNLGTIALRLNRSLSSDSATQRFVNDDAANRLISQPMRGTWSI